MRLPLRQRKVLATAIVAAAGAIVAEHMLKPSVKRKLRVK